MTDTELNLKTSLITINYTVGKIIVPRYIVIHETANPAKGADADAHRRYFGTNKNAKASAHFVVDDTCAVQLGKFLPGECWEMWHVGKGRVQKQPIYNSNSIGIEICINADGDYEKARRRAILLTRYVLAQTGLSADRVVRHYDAWGKNCPAKMLASPVLWEDFKEQVSNKTVSAVNFDTKKCRHFAQT